MVLLFGKPPTLTLATALAISALEWSVPRSGPAHFRFWIQNSIELAYIRNVCAQSIAIRFADATPSTFQRVARVIW